MKSPHGPLQAGPCLARKQLCRKGPESMTKLSITQKKVLAVEGFQILGCVSRSAASPSTQIIPPLYSIFATPHVEYSL